MDAGGPPEQVTSLTFVPTTTLTLEPRQAQAVNVVAGPPGHHRVRFALLTESDAPNDASLDRLEAVTDENGIATVVVTAPSAPSTFALRASINDKIDARLAVSVSAKGYGSLVIEPNYLGRRPIGAWVSSLRVGSSCADLSGFPPTDGALGATAPPDEPIRLSSVPVGPLIAVGVRAGHYAYGCTTLDGLGTNEERTVRVDVTDRPMALEEGSLSLRLNVTMTTEAWSALLENAIDLALTAFRGESTSDVSLLLDEIGASIASDTAREDYAGRRLAADFDKVVSAHFEANQLRDAVTSWLATGASEVSKSGSFHAELTLGGSSGRFELVSAGGVDAAASGFLGTSTWTTFADPGDTLVMGGALRFQASRWVTALAEAPATQTVLDSKTVPEALAHLARCEDLGAELVSVAENQLFEGCDEDCAVDLCESALIRIWTRTQNAGAELSRLNVALTGSVGVDDHARPLSLDGSWVGTLADGSGSTIGGAAKGSAPLHP